jgi:hypothetical protein
MENKIIITLEDKTIESLKKLFNDDEAINDFIKKAIDNELKKNTGDKAEQKNDAEGLENYLKSGKIGSRDYGIKGQGW